MNSKLLVLWLMLSIVGCSAAPTKSVTYKIEPCSIPLPPDKNPNKTLVEKNTELTKYVIALLTAIKHCNDTRNNISHGAVK